VKTWAFFKATCRVSRIRVDVQLHRTEALYKEATGRDDSVACFQEWKGNTKDIGEIHLHAEDHNLQLSIIHEAFHAGICAQRKMGRRISSRYEEKIVTISAELADKLLVELLDCSI
jgi:hypothetical protein